MGSSRSLVLSLSATLLTKDATNQTTLMFLVEWNQKKFKKRLANCQSLLLRPFPLFKYFLTTFYIYSKMTTILSLSSKRKISIMLQSNLKSLSGKQLLFFLTHLFGTTRVTTCVDFLFRGFNGFRPTTSNLVL